MSFVFDLASWSIKFYEAFTNVYQSMKRKAFENHWIYYAVYDVTTKQYIVMYDYNNVLSTLFFYIFRYWLGFYMSQKITLNDLVTFQHTSLVAIIYYIQNKHDKYIMYNENMCNLVVDAKYSILYAHTDTGEDLTHEFEKFKSTIFGLGLGPQDIYNMLMGFKRIQSTQDIKYIKYMTDDTFEDQLLKENP
jgi:hypothetical protein